MEGIQNFYGTRLDEAVGVIERGCEREGMDLLLGLLLNPELDLHVRALGYIILCIHTPIDEHPEYLALEALGVLKESRSRFPNVRVLNMDFLEDKGVDMLQNSYCDRVMWEWANVVESDTDEWISEYGGMSEQGRVAWSDDGNDRTRGEVKAVDKGDEGERPERNVGEEIEASTGHEGEDIEAIFDKRDRKADDVVSEDDDGSVFTPESRLERMFRDFVDVIEGHEVMGRYGRVDRADVQAIERLWKVKQRLPIIKIDCAEDSEELVQGQKETAGNSEG